MVPARLAMLAGMTAGMTAVQAASPTFWTGPNTNYSQATDSSTADLLVTGAVSIKRHYQELLFNPAAGETGVVSGSPADTEWATATAGTLADLTTATNLTYVNFGTWSSGPPYTMSGSRTFNRILNVPAVLHLKNENVYLSIKFTYWGSQGQGLTVADVSYTRSTPAVVLPSPTVSITNPAAATFFSAPANVKIAATAAVSSGSVTNVSFFGNGALLGSDQTSPFSLTTGSLAAGAYSLTAVAMAAGISTTSSVVNITVISPVTVLLSAPKTTNSQFSFDYSADPGLAYMVQSSSNLINWLPLVTNVASTNLVHFTDNSIPGGSQYYRVGRQPNP